MSRARTSSALAGARRSAKDVLRQAERGDADAAAVLVDALIYAGQSVAAESLAFALAGRAYSELGSDNRYPWGFERGAPLPRELQAENVTHALDLARRSLFVVRKRPCMPNRAGLVAHYERVHGPIQTPEDRRHFARLWGALQRACTVDRRDAFEAAMSVANDLLRGHGVEVLAMNTTRAGRRWGLYVNAGDTYNETLFWDAQHRRFIVTTWGDVVENWEYRWGRADE